MPKLPLLDQPPQEDQYEQITRPLVFRLKSVTPIFMAGAHNVLRRDVKNPKTGQVIATIPEDYAPELREASFRGALRYWYRVCQGSFLANNLPELRRRESAVFGSTMAGSPFDLSVHKLSATEKRLPMLIHGVHERIRVPALEEVKLDLTFRARSGQVVDDGLIRLVLTLLTEFGGVGKRSRRGFGSLQLVNNRPIPASGEKLKERVERLCNYLFGSLTPGTFPNLPAQPVMHPDHCKVLVGQRAFDTYKEAMQVFWDGIRSGTFKGIQVSDNPVFGMASPRPRLAAPVRLHISRSDEGYHPVVVAFRTGYQYNGAPLNWSLAAHTLGQIAHSCSGAIVHGGAATW